MADSERDDAKPPAESLDVPLELDEVEEVEDAQPAIPAPRQTQAFRAALPPVGGKAPPPPVPRPVVAIPPPRAPGGQRTGSGKPPVIPLPRATAPIAVPSMRPVVSIPAAPPGDGERPKPPTEPPPLPRSRTPSNPPPPTQEEVLAGAPDITQLEGGVEVSTAIPKIVVDQPLESQLEHPTVVDKALAGLGDAGSEQRAEAMTRELEAKVLSDPQDAAFLAYELGELYERRLADEARAVKAYGRAVNLDPSLRANLWAIRRVFYRRALWPNLAKLVAAEVEYARDDEERADLLLEKARVHAHHLNERDEARAALDEAVRIAPQHQGALLELERIVARTGDTAALLDVWERLAEAVEQPARKIAYYLEVGRAAAAQRELARAQEAFDRAAELASGPSAERIARERLRIAEDFGAPADIAAAIERLADLLLAAFGPAGPSGESAAASPGERPDRAAALRLELVALRRRQAQLARGDAPERAWELLQQASALSPGEPIVLADLTELAEELGRYDDLAELVQSWQAVEGDPARAMVLSIRRADALLRGGQRDQARALLASLEAAAPGFIILTSAAERDALGRGDMAALANTYLTAAHAALLGTWMGPGQPTQAEPAMAAALYVQAAELLAYEVATPESVDEARAVLQKALEAVAEYAPALEALTELDEATGQVGDALVRLRAAAAREIGEAKRGPLERALRLARSHGDLEAVLELERELVAIAPGDVAARWRLEATLGQLARDDERAELLIAIAAAESDAIGRGTALSAAARLRERSGAVEAATELYRQVLALWPEDTFARESLIDLLRAQERWPELVAERRREAQAVPDGPIARRALREAAWVLEIREGDAKAAGVVYDEWLARMPDDRAALEGAARCRNKIGDPLGEVAAREAIAEHDPGADAHWLYARALERAGQADEAAEVYRALLAGEGSVAATNAALALGDLAAQRGDTVLRVEATAALARRTAEPRLGAALAEASGWLYALVLEDFERAQQSFEAAIELEPTRRGALLGAALVASKRGDAAALAQAHEGLARAVAMPDAAAALLLRAALMAAAAGDLDLANQRVIAARAAAPDDTSALLVTAETGTMPQVEAADPFAAVDPLLARAEVLEMRSALADDPDARASWELDRAEALELAGRLREAGAVVAAVLKTRPDDLRALSALRRMAKRAGDKATTASSAFALARVLGDHDARLVLLREAAVVFDGPGITHNTDYAVAAYKRIVATDPGAPEHDRLLELLRERADVRALLGVLGQRLAWIEAENRPREEAVPLLLERATVLHGLGDHQNAMADLDALLDRAPDNVEALRFRADLAFNAGDVTAAVTLWRRYLGAERRPQRRAEVELQLSQVLAENTGDVVGAIEQLERVVDANPEDAALHERLLGLCLRANDWERATRELRSLARMRSTPQEKARDELRLGLMLRDRMKDRVGARLALDRARALDPLNLDVVRELAELLEPAARTQVLSSTAASFRAGIAQAPNRALLYERIAQITAWQADVDARWVSLVAVEALGTPTVDQRQVLAQGRQHLRGPTKGKLDEGARAAVRGSLGGPLHELWRTIAPAVQVATGVDPGKLGFTRGDRIAQKKLGDKYEPLATALGAFAVDDVELYVSANRPGTARALAAETPVLCLGADVAGAQTPSARFLLGRCVAQVAEGIATLGELHEGELAWTLAAALRACDAQLPPALADQVASDDNAIAERAKVLKKELSRKAKQTVLQLAQHRAAELGDVASLRGASVGAAQRAGLLWCGDLAVALALLDVGKGGRSLTDSAPALELVAWSVSETHLKLRERIGVALGAVR
ncbi:MAG TPA: tetratricopeptide repeat protein [Kofleriaceae bacterium]|nr:tetratricopeptide repeat protein [Kofleriaceae bacterium]